mmetsp:Transcript_98939/g.255763  ORF Transcript_98939/g.255763 Transcript_98939/m.255763 type:complete len:82 (+) Transcript_98939:184-429(+)
MLDLVDDLVNCWWVRDSPCVLSKRLPCRMRFHACNQRTASSCGQRCEVGRGSQQCSLSEARLLAHVRHCLMYRVRILSTEI